MFNSSLLTIHMVIQVWILYLLRDESPVSLYTGILPWWLSTNFSIHPECHAPCSLLCLLNAYSLFIYFFNINITQRRESGFPGSSVIKNPSANAGDMGSVPGLGRFHGEGNDNPLQYSCLKNPMDREAWQATIQRVTKTKHTEESLF